MPTKTVKLEQIADVFAGHFEPGVGADDPRGTHRLVFIGSIDPGPAHRLLPSKCPRFTPNDDPGGAVLSVGDLVMPARGVRRDVALLEGHPHERPLVAASFLHVVRPHPAIVDAGYLAWWLNQPTVRTRLAALVRGSNMPFLPLEETRAIKVVLPPLELQRQIRELHRLSLREFEITTTLRRERRRLIDAISLQVVKGAIRK